MHQSTHIHCLLLMALANAIVMLAEKVCRGFFYVPWVEGGGNIDLFPEGFLWDRGCSITRGKEHVIHTPKERVINIKMWGSLPYVLKDDLQRIIDPGRSGHVAQIPTAARVCRNLCTPGSEPGALEASPFRHV